MYKVPLPYHCHACYFLLGSIFFVETRCSFQNFHIFAALIYSLQRWTWLCLLIHPILFKSITTKSKDTVFVNLDICSRSTQKQKQCRNTCFPSLYLKDTWKRIVSFYTNHCHVSLAMLEGMSVLVVVVVVLGGAKRQDEPRSHIHFKRPQLLRAAEEATFLQQNFFS